MKATCVLLCVALMICAVVKDIHERRIPRQLCWGLAGVGTVLQICAHGFTGAYEAASAALMVSAALAVLAMFQRRFRKKDQIGGGDVRCMIALACATGGGCFVGAFSCFAAALVYGVPRRLMGRLQPGEGFPFAPFLAIWLVVGLAASLL